MMSPYKHRKRPRYDAPTVEAMTEPNRFSCSTTEQEAYLKTEADTSYYTGLNPHFNKNPDSGGEELEYDARKPRYQTPEAEDVIRANLSLCSEDEPYSVISEADFDTIKCSGIYSLISENPDDTPDDRLPESDTSQTSVIFNHEFASDANGSSKWQSDLTGHSWSLQAEPSINHQTSVNEKLSIRRERLKRNALNLIGGDAVKLQFNHRANGCVTWQHKLTRYFRNLVAKQSCDRLTSTGSDEELYISMEEDREKLQPHCAEVVDLRLPLDAHDFSTWQCNSTDHDLDEHAESHFDRPTSYGHYEKPYFDIKNSNDEEPFCLGLPNLEQTCYMNATLQALLSLTPFVQEVSKQRKVWSYCPTSEVMRWFMKVKCCRFSNNNKTKTYILAAFKMIVAAFNPEFEDSFQKDAHEFLTCVLDMMKSQSVKLQKSACFMGLSYTCPVNAHIAFQMLSTRTCTGCGVQSFKNEDYINLALDLVPGGSLRDCLEEYLKESELEYKCECGAEKSTLSSSFLNLPNVLIVQLKRFTFTHLCTGIKLDKPVHVLQDLEVNPGKCGSNIPKTHYCLISIISHLGKTPDSGHYVCDVVRRDTSGVLTDDWLIFSDMQVWEATGASIFQWRERTAYLLFYEKTP
ncbi:ubiquitin carboxyl-terminal hydrolase 37-like [Solea senegalensis]|uniref:Ubiquitin carboxyl-terminal hydrolase 37-like n=1 Tax=Solea senegalensis TaxID=28829 RepID=A0AAV6QYP7_SOLSE|nr:ubiquitin carboxyl-terminal hydrolase 26-like [Solea senegalensis]KAG7497329.1 ubiquitin carboxyl-terminal hydrolase 37-like [Solea senegalensis]